MSKKTTPHFSSFRVLFVCLGNICRSPLAEGVFADLVQKKGLNEQFKIDSCGTADYHVGELADSRSRNVALKHGIELAHRVRQFKTSDFEEFDLILVMDLSNYRDVCKKARSADEKSKVQLLSAYDLDEKFPKEVPDPYYDDEKAFEKVYQQVLYCGENLLTHLINN